MWIKSMLFIHVILGFVGLLSGIAIMFIPKGTPSHMYIGRIFTYGLGCSMVCTFPLSILSTNVFLGALGVWTLYMLVSGSRALHLFSKQDIGYLDWAAVSTLAICSIGLLILGWSYSGAFRFVAFVFGIISGLFVFYDMYYLIYFNPRRSIQIRRHIQRKMGAFIASITAFVVVNGVFTPSVIAWLLPTFICTPLIVYWTRQYR